MLCKSCPGKLRFTMKVDTGVKKAVALRLRFILEDEVRKFFLDKENPFLNKNLTPTQKKRLEREYRKRINALRIVIEMCMPYASRHELPSWFAVIPDIKKDQPKNEPVVLYPKPKPIG